MRLVDLSTPIQAGGSANPDRWPPRGFLVACIPLRLVGGSAAPARVAPILGDQIRPSSSGAYGS